MKRQRANNQSICEENTISLSTVEGMTKTATPQERSYCRRRYSRSRSFPPFLPMNLLVGLCFVSTLTSMLEIVLFLSLPVAHASMSTTSTRGIASAMLVTTGDTDHDINEEKRFNFIRERRIKQDEHVSASDDSSEQSASSSNAEECTLPAGKCTDCTSTEQKAFDVCHETGRWQKFQCILPSDSQTRESEDEDVRFEMMSCKHTDYDNGVAMMRLQIFCLTIGALSIISVRKQKRLYANMFDRRKQQGSNAARSNATTGSVIKRSLSRDGDDEIEFTPMTNQRRERVPLVETRMEII